MDTDQQLKMLEQLYREMYPGLLRLAMQLLGNHALAEEAVQDTFRIACIRMEELESSESRQGWLVLTLKNVIRNRWKSQTRLRVMLEKISDRDLPQKSHDEQKLSVLYGDLAETPEFKLIRRLAVDGCTMKELAEEQGVSLETCKKRAQRARAKLKKILSEEENLK